MLGDVVFTTEATAWPAPFGCPANADGWQSKQNGYCADSYGWPLRPDGSTMTREDIEAAARAAAVKNYWPYAAGALILLLFVSRRR